MSIRRREEVVNVVLAQACCDSGLLADPENILSAQGRRNMPDVVISFQGLRCAVDGKYNDNPNAKAEVLQQVRDRIEIGLCHVGVGVVYPADLRTTGDFHLLKQEVSASELEFFIATETLAAPMWHKGNLTVLLEELRRSHTQLAQDDVVTRSVEYLRDGMRNFTATMMLNPVACNRMANLLGVYEETKEKAPEDDE